MPAYPIQNPRVEAPPGLLALAEATTHSTIVHTRLGQYHGRPRYTPLMLDTFHPLLSAAHGVDLSNPATARATLTQRLDPQSPAGRHVSDALKALLAAGSICERGALPVRYGRVSKAVPETRDFSIDVVHMNGPGPHHVHPLGEANWCIALEGDPRFDGQPEGWVVMPPGSGHIPTVTGGTMLIVYLLPQGQIQFTQR